MCVFLCVHPWGYELHSYNIESVQQPEQTYYILKCNSIHWCGLRNKAHHESKQPNNKTKSHFSSCTLVTRCSSSVIKVGIAYTYQERAVLD